MLNIYTYLEKNFVKSWSKCSEGKPNLKPKKLVIFRNLNRKENVCQMQWYCWTSGNTVKRHYLEMPSHGISVISFPLTLITILINRLIQLHQWQLNWITVWNAIECTSNQRTRMLVCNPYGVYTSWNPRKYGGCLALIPLVETMELLVWGSPVTIGMKPSKPKPESQRIGTCKTQTDVQYSTKT